MIWENDGGFQKLVKDFYIRVQDKQDKRSSLALRRLKLRSFYI